jgi:hypothetical protein
VLAEQAVVVERVEEAEGPPADRLQVLRQLLANVQANQCVTID